jgi:hypothetical protein
VGIKYAVNEKFFEEWSPEMAYILGYIYADGSLEDASYLRGKYLRLLSTDRITIERIRALMKSEHTIVVSQPTEKHPGKTSYFIRIGSHKIYDDLIKLGLYPNKSLTIELPTIPWKYIADFTRGYLDGDGCIYLEKINRSYGTTARGLRVIFTSGSKLFLEELARILHARCEIRLRNLTYGQRAFRLSYSTKDSIILLNFLYEDAPIGLFLDRKYEKFQQYLSLRNESKKKLMEARRRTRIHKY